MEDMMRREQDVSLGWNPSQDQMVSRWFLNLFHRVYENILVRGKHQDGGYVKVKSRDLVGGV